jgi:hypothetical protein
VAPQFIYLCDECDLGSPLLQCPSCDHKVCPDLAARDGRCFLCHQYDLPEWMWPNWRMIAGLKP